ncbi:DNA-dependent RNA polymerase i subunit a43 [Phlyctema vagabunda]|uniref:DNA-directed RNA polymerase subunit n=1 Tax=Phlyctema vagabunda TaxID=108571 RepID=A0ABR4PH52_9HELO
MSIETAAQTPMAGAITAKKIKSHDGKKRKRDQGEDGPRSKSKKHRTEKTIVETSDIVSPPNESPFHLQTCSLYLPLAPVSQRFPLEGLCAEHISPLILTYYPPFSGVVLSYSNPRISEVPYGDDGDSTLLKSIDEYAVSWAWLTADFLLFKPEKGAKLEGYVNLQNEGHLGIVCWNLFNASIERRRLPADWKWVGVDEEATAEGAEVGENYAEDGIGYYVDGEGKRIEGSVKFRVRDIESSHDRERGFLSIEGTMLSEEAENELIEQSNETQNRGNAGRRLGGSRALGATSLGVPMEPDPMDAVAGKKQRQKY